VAGWVTR